MNERVTVELEVDSDLLRRAREAGLDLSFELMRELRRTLPLQKLSDEERQRLADQDHIEK
jgi:post-segregation antitoxin (ccd killing protein)